MYKKRKKKKGKLCLSRNFLGGVVDGAIHIQQKSSTCGDGGSLG